MGCVLHACEMLYLKVPETFTLNCFDFRPGLRREPGTDKISPCSSGIHMCNICNKTFTFNWTLNRHKQSVHQKLHNYKCDICARWFSRKDYLAVHLSVHSKNAKFVNFP